MGEATIEGTVVGLAEAAGWLARKLTYPGRRGAPDRMFIKGGRVEFVEFKRPGKRPDPLQSRELQRLRDHGMSATCVDSVAQGCQLLGLPIPERYRGR